MKRLYRLLLAVLIVTGVWGCDGGTAVARQADRWVMSLSVSSDGRHAVSVHADRRVVLWDLERRTSKVISTNGNLYSAYFVKGRDLFLWQDLDDVVHLTRLDGTDERRWKHFPTYGHVISSDLAHYFSSDKRWNVYHGYGGDMQPVKKDGDNPSFLGSGKLLNMQLSSGDRLLLTAGAEYDWDNKDIRPRYPAVVEGQRSSEYAGTVVWDVATLKPLAVLYGHAVKTHATFSPDGRYVVSGGENSRVYVWDAKTRKKLFKLGSLTRGIVVDKSRGPGNWVWDKTGLIDQPKDFSGDAVLAVKFIDIDNHYLRFTAYQHYAILYSIDSPLPLKYLDLGTRPFPATRDYSRNTAIDTAPAAGILVMGQAVGPGINVYKYDKATQTLKRVWVAR